MANAQDPNRQVNYLQQVLENDKKPIAVFLGAGCPVAIKSNNENGNPLIPDIEGITGAVRTALSAHCTCDPLLKIVDGHSTADGIRAFNVEGMLSHIRGLRAVAGKDSVRGLSASALDTLDDVICHTIHDIVDKKLPTLDTPYHRMASWIDAISREHPVEIFTTNYDLLMEQALEDRRVPYFDGFAGSRNPFFDVRAMEEDTLPPRWARLWKLHGSINWYQIPTRGVFRGLDDERGVKRVIHPSHLKYEESRRMPYLAMIDRLKAFLRQPSAAIVICGYSFRDEHINEVLVQGLQGTPKAIAFALLFDKLENYPQARNLASERSNLIVLARDGSVIGSHESSWLHRDPESVAAKGDQWVEWKPSDPNKEDSPLEATFRLGDFATFGHFLRELTGSPGDAVESPNVK